jgi:DNA modification methylase
MAGDEARLLLTDEPYNVPIAGHVTSRVHREFKMASGEMSDAQFRAFNADWMSASITHLCDGGLFGTFIDWRGYPAVIAAAQELGLTTINLIVWAKSNGGMGSLFRSQHELLPLFKKGNAPHTNNVELGKHGRWRSNLWTYPGASSMGSEARQGLQHHPTVKSVTMLEDALLDMSSRSDIILDPFLGSGSTLIATERTGRPAAALSLIRSMSMSSFAVARQRQDGQPFSKAQERRILNWATPAGQCRSSHRTSVTVRERPRATTGAAT